MRLKLHIDRIDFNKLTKEFGKEVEEKIFDFLLDKELHTMWSADGAVDPFDAFEAGYVAAQNSVSVVTVIENNTEDELVVYILPGSSEKLCRDLSVYLKGE